MRVLAAFRDNAANYYRLQAPFMVLKQKGLDVDIKRPALEDAEEYDVLWLQMHAEPVAEIVMRAFLDKGKAVVYDVDDWLFELPPSWGSYDHYFQRGTGLPTERLKLHERALAFATVITCTTEYLRGKLLGLLPAQDIRVLPNCVLMGDWDTLPDAGHEQDGPVLGWFGTGNHWDDWREIASAVESAVAKVDGYLALIGAPELVMGFPESLRARTLVNPLVPMARFHETRPLIKAFDVGLAWATDSLATSLCRSPLKIFQYGAAGVPFVASETIYGEVLRDVYYYTPAKLGELTGQLVEALTQAEYPRQRSVAAWQARVFERHSYETQAGLWLNIVEELCSN